MRPITLVCCALILGVFVHATTARADEPATTSPAKPDSIRVATFNTSLNDDRAGGLIERLRGDDANARKTARIIQTVRPDIVLLNEFDYDEKGKALALFRDRYLAVAEDGKEPIHYEHAFIAPVNTGVPSGLDLDGDGKTDGPADAWGFGRHPGQYGMVVLSRFPIDTKHARTFQKFLWSKMPDAFRPRLPDAKDDFYSAKVWRQLRLSSKSHWDLPVTTPFGVLHVLAHHPTPPVFDGAENRNGLRNHDEIRFWADYIAADPKRGAYIRDDRGQRGGLDPNARFVILGDHNADPNDGESYGNPMQQLLEHERVNAEPAPTSEGAAESSLQLDGVNRTQRTPPATDTSMFGPKAGNLRVDYVLPSAGIATMGAHVFWPTIAEPDRDTLDASDHRMVYLDLRW